MLQVGYSGALGIGLLGAPRTTAFARPAAGAKASGKSGKSVVLIWTSGAMSHLDTLDPKPDAAAEIRGEFAAIDTKIPGVSFTELMPKLSERANKFAVVRTLTHRENNHLVASHHVTTGRQQPGAFFDKVASRDDWPCFAGAVNALRAPQDGTPAGVHVPWHLFSPTLVWPGQHAGFLGPKHDPIQLHQNPNAKDFKVENVGPAAGLDVDQLDDRATLLKTLHAAQLRLAGTAEAMKLDDQQSRAFRLLTGGKMATAFDLTKEDAKTRDAYGRHPFGQTLLLARRLVEAGVPMIQANMGKSQAWDNHDNIFNQLKTQLVPPLDVALSTFLDDLQQRGLLDNTLVVLVGEFGRTPKLSKQNPNAAVGRDHWASCFSALVAGAGVRGGQVLGKSDGIGAYPSVNPFSPDDLGATIYRTLGISPDTELHDRLGRPVTLNLGKPIDALFTG